MKRNEIVEKLLEAGFRKTQDNAKHEIYTFNAGGEMLQMTISRGTFVPWWAPARLKTLLRKAAKLSALAGPSKH